MSSRVLELRERRQKLWDDMKELLDSAERNNRDMSSEENESWEKRNAELEEITREIENREKAEKLEERLAAPQPEPQVNGHRAAPPRPTVTYESAFKAYLRGGQRNLDNAQIRILNDNVPEEIRALSTTGTAGGYMIPQAFLNDMVRVMKAFGAVQRVARTITTESGASMPFPSVNDTANVGAILGENTQVAEQDVAWTQKTLGAFMYTSKLVRVSYQLMQDSAFDVEGELRDMLGERIARIQNTHFTTGAGTTEPTGLVTGGTVGVTAAAATAITSDEIINLVHSVDPAYRQSGRARFMLNDAVLATIRKLKDGNDNYIWQPSMQAGVPDSLFGYPVEVNQAMAAPAIDAKPVAFGDFYEGYLIRTVRGFQLLRMDERYADYLQVGFLGFSRADGLVRNAAAYRVLQMAAA